MIRIIFTILTVSALMLTLYTETSQAQTSPIQIQFGSANANMLQQLATGDLTPRDAATDLAGRAGIDLSQAQTIVDNVQNLQNLGNMDFGEAADFLDQLTNRQISGNLAQALSGLDIGNIVDVSQINNILNNSQIVQELNNIANTIGSLPAVEQITNIVNIIGGTDALQNFLSSGISNLVSSLPSGLVNALGGPQALTDALTSAVGLTITLTPVSTTDPGTCDGCNGSQNRGPTTLGRSCSFCNGIGSGCRGTMQGNHNRIRTHMTTEFENHRQWLVNVWWRQHLLPALTKMNIQFSVIAIQQVKTIGTFFDAKHQLETQRLLQQLSAEAYKDYTPSEGMCEVGTSIRSLAASERKSDITQTAISNRQIARNLRGRDTVSSKGKESDKTARRAQFVQTYCDKTNNANGLRYLCETGTPAADRINKDINYNRTFLSPLTLDIDMSASGTSRTQQEEDVFALSANLYAHNVLPSIAAHRLADGTGKPRQEAYDYMNLRSIVAKRSVAMNSFSAITAHKSSGSDEVAPFLKRVVTEMGVPDTQIDFVLGETPSYHAQMEVLTKKIYQNPIFYTELYDKPANVRRKGVMLRAVNLMQERDIYDSLLRNEAILAVTLETMLDDEQQRVNTRLETTPDVNENTDMVAR